MNDLDYKAYALEHFAPRIEKLIAEYADIAAGKFGSGAKAAVLEAEVNYDLRGRAAGEAGFRRKSNGDRRYKLRFNPRLIYHNVEEFMRRTVPHELAHIIDYALRDKSAHDKRWKMIMMALGATPERCHSYAGVKKARNVKRYVYHCYCREHRITSIRHNKILKGRANYKCNECHGVLVKGPMVKKEVV